MNSILLFEPNHDDAANIGFLLKLAGCRCTLTRTLEEACSWLKSARYLDQGFDAFLLGSQFDVAGSQLLQSSINPANPIPLIYLQRDEENQPTYIKENMRICQPEDLIIFLRDLFDAKDQSTENREGEVVMAEALARNQETEQLDEDSMEGRYLTFVLAEEGYGLEIRYVTEIIGIQQVTSIPDMPEHVKGVLNLRGKVIPVIDVRIRFHLPEREYDDRTCIIVVDVDERTVGLVVDKVSEVIDIPLSDIEPAPMAGTRSGNAYIRGMGKIEQQVKILLDIERLIKDEDLSEVEVEAEAV